MSIADKLTAIAENEQKVYDAGRQAEQDQFWEDFQESGKRTNYKYAFYSVSSSLSKFRGWTDNNFNPKYPIICSEGLSAEYMMAGSHISHIDVPVKITISSCPRAFFNNPNLHTIKSLEVTPNVTFTGWFDGHTALRNITINGVIGNSISFKDCPLSLESAISVINALSHTASSVDNRMSVTFSSETIALLDEAGSIFDGYPWWEYLVFIGWVW